MYDTALCMKTTKSMDVFLFPVPTGIHCNLHELEPIAGTVVPKGARLYEVYKVDCDKKSQNFVAT